MKTWRWNSASEDDTERLAIQLAKLLPPKAAVALDGTLGAGKTRFTQALAAAAGVDRKLVQSPTFVLVHEYPGPTPIFHFDAYRLKSLDEWWDLGVEEYFERPGWCVVEWASKVEPGLPADRLHLHFDWLDETSRVVDLTAHGSVYENLLDQLSRSLEPGG